MRTALLCLLAGCVPRVDAPLALGDAETVLLLTPDGPRFTAIARDAASFGAPITLAVAAGTELHLLRKGREALRLEDAPAVLEAPTCPIDQLETTASLCFDGETFASCGSPTPRLVSRAPFHDTPCFEWDHDAGLARIGFNVHEAAPGSLGSATLALSLGGGRMLLGQRVDDKVGADTELLLMDTSPSASGEIVELGRFGPFPLHQGPGVRRDDSSAWVADGAGRVSRLDVRTGTLTLAVKSRVGLLADLARSPSDPELLLGLSFDCSLLLREGERWRRLSPPTDASRFAELTAERRLSPCEGNIHWDDGEEALVVGAALEPAASWEELSERLRAVVRVRGGEARLDPVPWPGALSAGFLTAVGAYVGADGARVELAAGFGSEEAGRLDLSQARKLWFVRDPRRGPDWTLIEDPDTSKAGPVSKLERYRDGVLGIGGYEQAFSDAYWTEVPEIALSRRAGRTLGDTTYYRHLAGDEHGGYVMAAPRDVNGGAQNHERFIWRKARPGR